MTIAQAVELLYKGSKITIPSLKGYWSVVKGKIEFTSKGNNSKDNTDFYFYRDSKDYKVYTSPVKEFINSLSKEELYEAAKAIVSRLRVKSPSDVIDDLFFF